MALSHFTCLFVVAACGCAAVVPTDNYFAGIVASASCAPLDVSALPIVARTPSEADQRAAQRSRTWYVAPFGGHARVLPSSEDFDRCWRPAPLPADWPDDALSGGRPSVIVRTKRDDTTRALWLVGERRFEGDGRLSIVIADSPYRTARVLDDGAAVMGIAVLNSDRAVVATVGELLEIDLKTLRVVKRVVVGGLIDAFDGPANGHVGYLVNARGLQRVTSDLSIEPVAAFDLRTMNPESIALAGDSVIIGMGYYVLEVTDLEGTPTLVWHSRSGRGAAEWPLDNAQW